MTTKDLVGKAIGTIENYFSRKGVLNGLGTGFPDLDRMTDGLHGSEMIVIAARPSMGKTSLAMNIVEHVVLEQKLPAAVFSLEMSAEVAGVAHDVFDCARESAEHPRRIHERVGFSEIDERGGQAGELASCSLTIRRDFRFCNCARGRGGMHAAAWREAFCG